MQSLSSQAHTQRSRRKGDNKVKVTSRARYFNLLLRQLRSPCTRSSSQRSLPAFHLHFHQCSSLNIEDVTELKGRRAWKDSPKPLQSAIPCTLTHRHTHTLLNHLRGKQQSVPDLRRKTSVAAKGSFSSVSRWQQEDTLCHYAIWNAIAALHFCSLQV